MLHANTGLSFCKTTESSLLINLQILTKNALNEQVAGIPLSFSVNNKKKKKKKKQFSLLIYKYSTPFFFNYRKLLLPFNRQIYLSATTKHSYEKIYKSTLLFLISAVFPISVKKMLQRVHVLGGYKTEIL